MSVTTTNLATATDMTCRLFSSLALLASGFAVIFRRRVALECYDHTWETISKYLSFLSSIYLLYSLTNRLKEMYFMMFVIRGWAVLVVGEWLKTPEWGSISILYYDYMATRSPSEIDRVALVRQLKSKQKSLPSSNEDVNKLFGRNCGLSHA